MAHAPKKKRLLPKNILDRPDGQIAEKLFGKAAKRELDKLLSDVPEKSINQAYHKANPVSSI